MALLGLVLCLLASGCDEVFDLEPISLDDAGSIDDDDGRAHDAYSGPRKLVFVTSVGTNGNLGGLEGADAHCQTRAAAGGLPGAYMAWLSTSSASPASRMLHGTAPYVLVGGAVVANNWDDLVDGRLETPIELTEFGEAPVSVDSVCESAEVWSNTTAAGTWNGVDSCSSWGDTSGLGTAARYIESGIGWTEPTCTSIGCNLAALPIYCFEQ